MNPSGTFFSFRIAHDKLAQKISKFLKAYFLILKCFVILTWMMKLSKSCLILTVDQENFLRLSWKSWSVIKQISVIAHANVDCLPWLFLPFIMKILTIHQENINYSSWKFWSVIMKISNSSQKNLYHSSWKSWLFIKKISTLHHVCLDHLSWKLQQSSSRSGTVIMKIWSCHNE